MAETSGKDIIKRCREERIEYVDLKFTDLFGRLQHFSVPSVEVDEALFEEGMGFDGSSIRGFQPINESDMLIVPDPASVFIDTVFERPTLSMICDIRDPVQGGAYSRDPRYVAKKAEAHLVSTGIADSSAWGPELEFFILDDIRYDNQPNAAYYYIDSQEAVWNRGADKAMGDRGKPFPNLGHRPPAKMGYSPAPPMDSLTDIRNDIATELMKVGIRVEMHHHEVATGGQSEISIRYDTLTKMGDKALLYKYIAKNVAKRHGKSVTFMPKPIFGDNGTGMHVHQSLRKDDTNLFYGDGYAFTSDMCRHYIAGLLAHAPALMAFCAPGTNSYKRLVPGYEAPVNLIYSRRNRSACIRIPAYSTLPNAVRIEFRPPDPTANPYLAFSALLMAGLDGIEKKMDPGDPMDVDLYELSAEEAKGIPQVPGSLEESLNALEADHDFLLKGGVFTPDLIETWIEYKRINEVDPVRMRPHPFEFALYYHS